MVPVLKFLRLSSKDKLLLAETTCVVTAFRVGLWLLPFRIVMRLQERLSRSVKRARGTRETIDGVAWAVSAVSRRIPGATCLTQAFAARALLSRRGCLALLRIGVRKGVGGELAAHAWVECESQVVVGGMESPDRFISLPPLED